MKSNHINISSTMIHIGVSKFILQFSFTSLKLVSMPALEHKPVPAFPLSGEMIPAEDSDSHWRGKDKGLNNAGKIKVNIYPSDCKHLVLTHARELGKIDSPLPAQPAPVKGSIASSKQVLMIKQRDKIFEI